MKRDRCPTFSALFLDGDVKKEAIQNYLSVEHTIDDSGNKSVAFQVKQNYGIFSTYPLVLPRSASDIMFLTSPLLTLNPSDKSARLTSSNGSKLKGRYKGAFKPDGLSDR